MFPSLVLLLAAASVSVSSPVERRATATNIVCTDANANINTHDKNVALLSICGGISGTIEQCQGNPTSTVGQSGDAKFTVNPVDAGATITISKGRWEQCIDSAEAVCPNGQAYTATCPLGSSTGNTNFALTLVQ